MPFIIGGAILAGAAVSAYSADQAANTQADAAGNASDVQQRMYNQTRQDLLPWQQTGQSALINLNQLAGLTPSAGGQNPNFGPFTLDKFHASPAYNFNLEQGMNAINKGANARGNLYAPQTLQDLGKFQQGLASNEFQNAYNNYNQDQGNIWNRLYALSAGGQSAANQTGAFGNKTGELIGNNITSGGASQAAGQVGVGNAVTGGLQNAYNAYLTNQILGRNQQSLYGT